MRLNSLLILCLVFGPVFGAVRPPEQLSSRRVGILRVGALNSSQEERAYALLESRIQNWMEGIRGLALDTEPLTRPLGDKALQVESSRRSLMKLSKSILADLEQERMAEAQSKLTSLKAQRASMEPLFFLGPTLQEAYLAEAAFWWWRNEPERARPVVQRARWMHPLGVVKKLPRWDWDKGSARLLTFQEGIRNWSRSAQKSCFVELMIPANTTVRINGFAVNKTSFQWPLGKRFYVEASTPSGLFSERISCRKVGMKRITFKKRPVLAQSERSFTSLAQISRRFSLGSLFLVKPEKQGFRFFLYSPEKSIDPIPLRRPVRYAELLKHPDQSGIPVATDAFLSLYERHHPIALLSENVEASERSLGMLEPSGVLEFETTPKWYNDWKVWAVAGGVLGGLVVTYLLTRENRVGAQTGSARGLKIHFD